MKIFRNKILLIQLKSFILLVLLIHTAFSQSGSDQTVSIAGITVEGNESADANTIISLSGLRIGDKLILPGDNKLQTALRNLWKRKQFSHVDIVVDRITPVGVFLIIKVKEFPRLDEIIIENNKEISEDKLVKEIGKVKGDIISNYDLYIARKRLKQLYSKEGLAFTKIETDLSPADKLLYSKLRVNVEEGIEFYVNSIKFEGNIEFSDGELASEFDETTTKSWWQFWKSSKFNEKEYKKDLELLLKFYKKEGFIDAEIIRDTVIYDDAKESVDIIVTLNEGKRIYLRNISFTGNTVYPSDLLLRRLNFSSGDAYNVEQFDMNLNANEDQTDVASLYLDNGFLSARFVKEEVRIQPDSVDVIIKVYEGEQFTIRKVEIAGNTKTKDKVIRRELFTRPGDYFNRSAIIRSVRALGVTQYFNPEKLKPDVRPVDNTRVDVIYKVEERSTDTFNASIGFAGTFGLTGAIGMTFNNFSITEPLQGGAGQVLNFQWEFGQASRYQNFVLGFTEPWLFDEPTTVGFNLFDRKQNYIFNYRTTGIALNLGRRFKWPDDYFRGNLSLRVQRNDVQSESAGFYRQGITSEITLGTNISRISLDNLFFPTVGSRFSLTNDFAMASVGLGSTDYLKSEINYEFYNPMLKINDYNRLVLYIGAKIGYIDGIKSDTTIPPIELYRMGGNGLSGYFNVIPLRGYEDRSIGSINGGRVMSRYTAELRFAISVDPMPIFIYGFAEAGNVWENFRFIDPFDLKRAAGIGVQLMINPIGIIGFSYGYGFDVDDRTGVKSGWQFLFHLGQQ